MQEWVTPLGRVPVDTAAAEFLSARFNLPVIEAPHNSEHSIENQLPFLQHGAACGWDLDAAGCNSSSSDNNPTHASSKAAAEAARIAAEGVSASQQQRQQQQRQQPAALSIVPISIGYLGNQLHMIPTVGQAVRELLQHLDQQQQHSQGQQLAQQQQQQGVHAGPGSSGSSGGRGSSGSSGGRGSSGSSEVVLIVTSDFTHAGPWYRELPPAGVSLEQYMTNQDTPVLQVGFVKLRTCFTEG